MMVKSNIGKALFGAFQKKVVEPPKQPQVESEK
jgi:hypothetical protein